MREKTMAKLNPPIKSINREINFSFPRSSNFYSVRLIDPN